MIGVKVSFRLDGSTVSRAEGQIVDSVLVPYRLSGDFYGKITDHYLIDVGEGALYLCAVEWVEEIIEVPREMLDIDTSATVSFPRADTIGDRKGTTDISDWFHYGAIGFVTGLVIFFLVWAIRHG